MAKAAALAPVLIFAGIAAALGLSLRNDPHKMPSMLIDKPPPKFDLPPVLQGGQGISDADLKGQVLLLNVYASWCPGCRAEHSLLMYIAENGGVPLYGINWKDKPSDGGRWLTENKNPYVRVGSDLSGRTGIDMGVTGVPETFVLDSGGRIRFRYEGPLTEEAWQETLLPLLAELRGKQ